MKKNHIKSEIIVNINNKNLVYRPTYTNKKNVNQKLFKLISLSFITFLSYRPSAREDKLDDIFSSCKKDKFSLS